MARATTRKFERPPTFSGKDEDVLDFIQQYEKVSKYNGWTKKECNENLEMYLRGTAEKWWRCLEPPTVDWEDSTANVTTNGVTASVTTNGSKTRLLEAFKKGNYAQFIESKLRHRKHETAECAVDYAYDVLSLCRTLDPAMSECTKVNFLMGGLSADLTEILYPMHLVTTEQFLQEVKLIEEARSMAQAKREKVLAVMGEDSEESGSEDANETKDEEELQEELIRMDSEIAERILERNRMLKDRTSKVVTDTPKTMGVVTLTGGEKDLLVVALTVQGRPDVPATIDTGATVSAITPRLVEMLNLQVKDAGELEVRMLTGAVSRPKGKVFLDVETANGTKGRGLAYVMELPGLPPLLLGNDFLQQFRKLTIDYTETGPVLTLGKVRPEKRAFPKGMGDHTLVKMNTEINQLIHERNAFRKKYGFLREARYGDRVKTRRGWDGQGRRICHICKEGGHLMRNCDSHDGRPSRQAPFNQE